MSILLPDGVVLNDGTIGTTEIDMAFATTKGIFAVECKHRHSFIRGSLAADEWQDDRSIMKSPIKQNANHIRILRENMMDDEKMRPYADIPIYNVFVSNVPIILNVMGKEKTIDMIYHHNDIALFVLNYGGKLKRSWFMSYVDTLDDALSKESAEQINEYLFSHRGDKRALEAHINYVKSTHPEDL